MGFSATGNRSDMDEMRKEDAMAIYGSEMECNDNEFIKRLTPKNQTAEGFGSKAEYTPYRSKDTPIGSRPDVPILKIRPTKKRPFIIPPKVNSKVLESTFFRSIDGVHRQAVSHTWYFALGCSVFNGLCINQDDFNKIDCAQCIRSTFESFIKGCAHENYYVDHHGTRRCVACKDELGQDEPDDVPEMDDFSENDDVLEEGDDPHEYGDPEIFLGQQGMEGYSAWGIENKVDQTQLVTDSDYDQTYKPSQIPRGVSSIWGSLPRKSARYTDVRVGDKVMKLYEIYDRRR